MRIAVSGATGFVGRALCTTLRAAGETVITIGRGAGADVRWNPLDAWFPESEQAKLRGVDAVVHLAGATIAARWTESRKRAIIDSRVIGTQLLARALAEVSPRPRVLVCASAVGFYGSRAGEWLDEASAPGHDFLAGVVAAWEQAADRARTAGIRVVHLRQGVVIDRAGGALAPMRLAFLAGLGGTLGPGTQWQSWISMTDLVRAVRFALDDALALTGVVNAVAPAPVTNREFATTLGRVLKRPALLPAPAFALRAVFGEMADGALLASQRVRPARLAAAGFVFEHPTLESALRHTLGK